MIHTGTKLSDTVKYIKKMGCNHIYSFITHNLIIPKTYKKLDGLPINEIVTTNTINHVFFLFILDFSIWNCYNSFCQQGY